MLTTKTRPFHWGAWALIGAIAVGVSGITCDDDFEYCRQNPQDCPGDIGGPCDVDDDCLDGVCCKDKNCGGGMCTYPCKDDLDCPDVMACEHKVCFFSCIDDLDCGAGQSCEHGHTICEYEH